MNRQDALVVDGQTLARMPNPYVVKVVDLPRGPSVICASEGYGPVVQIDPVTWTVTTVADGPGGCLDVTPVPGHNAVYMIAGSFVGYDFHRAGVYRLNLDIALDTDIDIALASDADSGSVALPDAPASGSVAPGAPAPAADSRRTAPVRLFELPFAHRLQSFHNQDGVHLIAATIAQTKDGAGDWTRPGAVYQADLDDGLTQPRPGATPPTDTARTHIPATVPLPLRPVLTEIHKNHGLITDRGHLYITGAKGTYRAALPRTNGEPWDFQHIWHQEISELQFIDLDGDGTEELVTIEPFHGDRLVIYKVTSEAEQTVPTTGTTPSGGSPSTVPAQTPVLHLRKWLEKEIDFGHGLWTGLLGGVPSILVGNRAGHKNLELIRVSPATDRLITHTIAEGTGTAQVAVIHGDDNAPDSIIASNQEQGEIVRYSVS